MSLHLAGAAVINFPGATRFRRPRAIGLLPGRLVAGMPLAVGETEVMLDLAHGALTDGVADLQRPKGFWRHDRAHQVAQWHGLRTDSHPTATELPPTRLPLGEALTALAAESLLLRSAHLLHDTDGWRQPVGAHDTIRELFGPDRLSFTGIGGLFDAGGFDDPWEVELYSNGCVWADTRARLDVVLNALSGLAVRAR